MKPSFRTSSVKLTALSSALVMAGFLTACGGSDSSTPATTPATTTVTSEQVLETSAKIAFAAYSDSLTTAQSLETAIDAFVADPTEANLTAAKDSWKAAREPYGQTEVYRFDEGVVDDWEGKVNAWPLGEAMIDYVATAIDGDSGPDAAAPTVNPTIIGGANVDLSDQTALAALNEDNGDERNVATGYHAIEFMLWGQDLNSGDTTWNGTDARDATAGQRPVTDFSPVANTCTDGAAHTPQADPAVCVRRGDYLQAVTDLLITDLTEMKDEWDPAGTNNRYDTYTAGGDNSMLVMLSGMGRLSFGELAGERIDIARLNNSQEDEHSCFSDNTHRDIVQNAQGVQNSFLGSYNGTDYGSGVYDLLVSNGNQALADQLKGNIEATMTAANVISTKAEGGNPFDNQIQATDKSDIQAVITALINQASRDSGGSINDAATALGIDLSATIESDTEQTL